MRSELVRAFAVAFTIAWAFPVYADDATQDVSEGGQSIELLRDCQGRGAWYTMALNHNQDVEFFGDFDLMMCTSYISGIADMNALYVGVTGSGFFCFPERGLSNEQQIRVFIKWAAEHPESLHESKRSGVVTAFANAFPCE